MSGIDKSPELDNCNRFPPVARRCIPVLLQTNVIRKAGLHMINRVFCLFAVFVFAAVVLPSNISAENVPFFPGESLTYHLKWGVVPAGKVTFKVLPMTEVDGEKAYHFVMTARTNPFVDAVYKVRDRIDGFAAADFSRSLYYRKKQQEGGSTRDIKVVFDWESMTSQYTNYDRTRTPVAIEPGTFDPLSVMYAFRCIDTDETTYHEFPVTDGKRCESGRLDSVEKTRLMTRDGKVSAWLLEPDVSKVGGVFRKSKDAKLRIWLSDDEYRVPLRFSSKVAVGSFHGVLVKHVPGQDDSD